MHDYHIGMAMGFFTPLFLVMFAGIGGMAIGNNVMIMSWLTPYSLNLALMFLFRPSSSRLANFLTFSGLSLGVTIIVSFYYTEIAARLYCPLGEPSYLKLRAPYCYSLYNSKWSMEILKLNLYSGIIIFIIYSGIIYCFISCVFTSYTFYYLFPWQECAESAPFALARTYVTYAEQPFAESA